jgi:flagellar export protein FliJ
VARLQRVLDVREAAARRLEAELATLTRAALAAEQTSHEARGAWFDAMNVALPEPCSSADLAEAHGYAVTLGHRYDARVRELREAINRREACQVRLRAARIEVRKLELWRGRWIEAAAREETARERRATDELAARLTRSA